MKIIGYVRVSTEEQAKDGQSLQLQEAKIRAYCALNDLELTDVIKDPGISAKSVKGRPNFVNALESIYKGKADGLIVWRLDRAFRSTQDALAISERLRKKGRVFISVSEKIDTGSAFGEFFFTLLASLATMERKIIGERTAAALRQKKENHEKTGGMTPFGYRLSADGVHLEPDDREQQVVKLISRLKSKGHSYRAIARHLNEKKIKTKSGRAWTHVQVSNAVRYGTA
jgi:DNA invertase Pin-like site-specific DNA recombinase